MKTLPLIKTVMAASILSLTACGQMTTPDDSTDLDRHASGAVEIAELAAPPPTSTLCDSYNTDWIITVSPDGFWEAEAEASDADNVELRIYRSTANVTASTIFTVCGETTSTYSAQHVLYPDSSGVPSNARFHLKVEDLSALSIGENNEIVRGETLLEESCALGVEDSTGSLESCSGLYSTILRISSGRKFHRVQVSVSLIGQCDPADPLCPDVLVQVVSSNHKLVSANNEREAIPMLK